jgi:hypothetical protein
MPSRWYRREITTNNPYSRREPGGDNPHPLPDTSSKESPSSPEAVAAQDDGPLWYFRGVSLGLETLPGISGARRTLERSGKPRLAGRAEQDQPTSASQANRNTERSGVFLALETKFLLFHAGQKRDSVLSRSTGHRAFNWLRLWVRPVRPWPRARPRHWRGQRLPRFPCLGGAPRRQRGWFGHGGDSGPDFFALACVVLTSLRRSRTCPGSCGSGMPVSRCPPCKNRIPLSAQDGHNSAENCTAHLVSKKALIVNTLRMRRGRAYSRSLSAYGRNLVIGRCPCFH